MDSEIARLAATINYRTLQISSYLEENRLPYPSFEADAPIDLGLESESVKQSRTVAINALQELLDLLRGPVSCMLPEYYGPSLQLICRYEIAQKVPLKGQIGFEDLSDQCGLHVNDLKRIIRYAISFHRLFKEPKVGFVAHSAGSKQIATNDIIRAGLGQAFNEFYPSFSRTADALEMFKDHEPNHTGFALAHGTDGTMFDYLRAHPEKEAQFGKAMKCYSQNLPGFSESFLVHGYDWKSLGAGTLVDVGGSTGYVGAALAKANPELHVIVEDLGDVISDRPCMKDGTAAGEPGIRFVVYDFFTPQPIVADAYLFRWVFHDWPDHYVIRIVRNLVPALRPGCRVIVNESLSPNPHFMSLSEARAICSMDMLMMAMNNSRLRTADEWQRLFAEADTRFGRVNSWVPHGAALAILEVVWQGP